MGNRGQINTVIVGLKTEGERVGNLMDHANSSAKLLGYVSSNDKEETHGLLGRSDRLKDVCNIYNVDELIFCAKDVPSSKILQWMGELGTEDVSFKIVPEERYFVIGSDSKNSSGEFYTE